MSALDDAISAHMAHAAGSGTDPLTDALCDQCTAPAPLYAPHPAQAEAEEAIRVPRWALLLLVAVFLAGALWPAGFPWGSAPQP